MVVFHLSPHVGRVTFVSDHYRRAASVVLLRPVPDGGVELLLLRKPRRNDAWQLPQGGVEAGEDLEAAALRELMEEAGIVTCRVLGVSDRIYTYDFPASYRRFRPDDVCGQEIHFILAAVPRDTPVRVDGEEIAGFRWVRPEQAGKYVKRPEYLELVLGLVGEARGLLG